MIAHAPVTLTTFHLPRCAKPESSRTQYRFFHFARWLGMLGLLVTFVGGCGVLGPRATPEPAVYSLENLRIEAPAAPREPGPPSRTAPTLIVNPVHPAPGLDSQHILYVRDAHQLEYFAHSDWIDTPARMLTPLIVTAVQNSGVFLAVVQTPSDVAGDLTLTTELIRLQHDFGSQPSRVRITLRAYLLDTRTRKVLAWREFDESYAAPSESPQGGVVAANRAVQSALEQLGRFCAEVAAHWRPAG